MIFNSQVDSHTHSLETLELLNQHYEFMTSIKNVIDMGCGKEAYDMNWWANAHYIDDDGNKEYYDIQCTGIDLCDDISLKHKNAKYYKHNFEDIFNITKEKYDLVWSHDSFQYSLNPLNTLKNWSNIINTNGMLVLQIPSFVRLQYNKLLCSTPSYNYFHYTIDNLIYMLAVNGFDCRDGFFQQEHGSEWIKAVVYKTDNETLDPRKTSWYDLLEYDVLPDTVINCINKYGYVKREELVLKWLSGSNIWYGQ